MTRHAWRFGFLAMAALAMAAPPAENKAENKAAKAPTYDLYSAGDVSAARPGPTASGLMLLGGGDWPVPAFRWFVERMGGGHLVMLRASGTDDLQQDFLKEIGGAASVRTLVFHSREAASDPRSPNSRIGRRQS